MTVQDRCTTTSPHPAHRTQYGPFGVKDCPGIPITPANAPTVPTDRAPGPTPLRKPAPVELAIRELERRVGRLEDRVDEHLTPSEYDPADDEPEPTPQYVHHLLDAYLTGQPLDFHGARDVPLDVQRRLEHALTVPAPAWAAVAREQLLADLTGGKRPCPWCTGAPVFDSAEDLLTHARRNHLNDMYPYPRDEVVWLGHLSGFWVEANGQAVILRHRCGWTANVGIGYLANIIDDLVSAHRDAGCNPTDADAEGVTA